MGGRGSSSLLGGQHLAEKQEKRLEDNAQHNDAKMSGRRLGAKYYEYTDANGKVQKGETGANTSGGTYKTSYSEEVARHSKKKTAVLEKERNELKNRSNDEYQKFARSAASRSASQVAGFADAEHKIKVIDQILRRKKWAVGQATVRYTELHRHSKKSSRPV